MVKKIHRKYKNTITIDNNHRHKFGSMHREPLTIIKFISKVTVRLCVFYALTELTLLKMISNLKSD